jgi:HEAT repeat protein
MATAIDYEQALRRIYALEPERNIGLLIRALDNLIESGPNATVRAAAAAALGRLGDARAGEYLVPLVADRSEEVRYAAVRALRAAAAALSRLRQHNAQRSLRAAMQCDDAWVRLYAAEALAAVGDEEIQTFVAEGAARERFSLHEPLYSIGRRKRWRRLLASTHQGTDVRS